MTRGASLPVPLSVLDLCPVPTGSPSSEAVRRTLDLARHVERLGYRRYWLAEHHNMPGIASAAPAVLIAEVAAATSSIRVGSGGVMLPNHAALTVAEQFGTLEALHPGRIDLGIGRAPGTDPGTARALRRSVEGLSAEDFPRQLAELQAYFAARVGDGAAGDSAAGDAGTGDAVPGDAGSGSAFVQIGGRRADRPIRAVPAEGNEPAIWLLGSSGYSAQLAGLLGLPFAFAHHFSSANTVPALDLYRKTFTPSTVLAEPYCLIGVAVLCAPDGERARRLHGSSRLSMLRLRTRRPSTLPSPEEAAEYPYSEPELAVIAEATRSHVVGDPATVVDALAELVERTGVDELMVTTSTFDHADRLASYELLAEAGGVTPTGPGTAGPPGVARLGAVVGVEAGR